MVPAACRYRFLSGKGGAGKTTCAAALAVRGAEKGGKVLALSIDAAHSLGDALSAKLSATPRRIRTRRGSLWAAELNADRALSRWVARRAGVLRTIAERGTLLEGEEIDRFLGLSLPGVDELIALLEVRRLAERGRYQEVVVDTAPTGHTLRMLETPEALTRIAGVLDALQAKHRVLSEALSRRRRPDEAERLIAEIDGEGAALSSLLRDPARCAFLWVVLPEELAVDETIDGLAALRIRGIPVAEVIVNRLTPPSRRRCPLCDGRRRAEGRALQRLGALVKEIPHRFLSDFGREPRGLAMLRLVGARLERKDRGEALVKGPIGRRRPRAWAGQRRGPLPLDLPPSLKLLFFGGKGGVGKTTCAAAMALGLAARHPRKRLLLLSTDPAHSLADVLGERPGPGDFALEDGPPALRVRELDAVRFFQAERERYRRGVEELFDSLKGPAFDASFDREATERLIDLAPPGLDEIVAVLSVLEVLSDGKGRGRRDLVIVDTAPTGHGLRLLEMPGKAREWVKEILRVLLKYRGVPGTGRLAEELLRLSQGLRALERLLRDRSRARFVVVTRAGRLPVAQTGRLLSALRRLRLPLGGVVVNALIPPGCERCRRSARQERREIRRLAAGVRRRADGYAIISAPAVAPPPRGPRALGRWLGTWREE